MPHPVGLDQTAVIARTSLIVGDGDSPHEKLVHALASGASTAILFTDDVRCPVHVTDLAATLLELASSSHCGIHHVAGAVSSYEMGVLVGRRDGLDETILPAGRRAGTDLSSPRRRPSQLRPDPVTTSTRLRGARTFVALAFG